MAGVRPEKLTVSKIKSQLLNISQASQYRLSLSVPSAVRDSITSLNQFDFDNISLLCTEATLPGSSVATHDVTNDYHGVSERMAYRRIYDESISLTFYVDRHYKVVQLFEGWINYITGVDGFKKFEDPYVNHRMAYPNSYKNNIFLTKFEKDHFSRESKLLKTTLDYTFVQAFPLNITAMPLSYEQDQVVKCTVSFNYMRYVMERRQTVLSEDGEEQQRQLIVNKPFADAGLF